MQQQPFSKSSSCSVTLPQHVDEASPTIIDIRGNSSHSNTGSDMKTAVRDAIIKKTVPFVDSRLVRAGKPAPTELLRSLPTMVLYDDEGLSIFDRITYLDEYYLTNAEIDIFQHYADDIVNGYINNASVLVELGCGSMRKTKYILQALAKSGKTATYYAVDLSRSSLRESLLPLMAMFPTITFVGLWGTYDDSLAWLKQSIPASISKTYLWLGSSIGNLTIQEAAVFLRGVADNAMETGDLFFCGIDRQNSFEILSLAYNDSHGLTRDFILNGINHINTIFSADNNSNLFDKSNFEYVSIYNELDGRHEAYLKVLRSHTVVGHNPDFEVNLVENELINIEYSYKYSPKQVADVVDAAHLYHVGKWSDSKNLYDMHLFQKPEVYLSRLDKNTVSALAKATHPTLDQFEDLWKIWQVLFMLKDLIVSSMIPSDHYMFKPIDLRHPYIFYIGHLPSFSDNQLSRFLEKDLSGNKLFLEIFGRGIDPDMDCTTKCHDHSPVPSQWPQLSTVIEYQNIVRSKIREMYSTTNVYSKRLSRTLFMCYEHDIMHVETFLQMLVQDSHILPPRNVARPILKNSRLLPKPSAKYLSIEKGSFIMGHDDHEVHDFDESESLARFGWDNEYPAHKEYVDSFKILSRPVTVGEYFEFLESTNWDATLIPGSWTRGEHSQGYAIKTVFGPISVDQAWIWPVYVSNNQAAAFAQANDTRLPTEQELSFIRSQQPAADTMENNNFTQWTPRDVQSITSDQVTDLNGNGWEHTSTVFLPFKGGANSQLYPNYSSDFYHGKHNVLLGASWATMDSIASRRTFRNWYQRAYAFEFAKFRTVC
ncbi:hypothetical protein BATDEDRAFT_22786 [Batrachochytrium dendrobatidis JAM81]|uniref:Histidine-specific methyltransferase SAM-dependent domain-containing protein n=1 Tax=Batrachochytrium dendrobatidis (strain JAM81 / FGSC 10211) TaxID=684364 RepID=F4NXK1_BATDJ|nr:uncharacterized protein BATDEDRAFT_22786 [Batrachochytrium dendrobatidis JAM81]EGF82700.1 hypothetical protein BATDEDRAFT_22786 [Batrachochytrium dendrobatidis JAM81]|eukprot:XP_006676626.1 hypothetical protein BATDEDRAFT_22786 [Batrachochytrium dendrobatidis JAM81]